MMRSVHTPISDSTRHGGMLRPFHFAAYLWIHFVAMTAITYSPWQLSLNELEV